MCVCVCVCLGFNGFGKEDRVERDSGFCLRRREV